MDKEEKKKGTSRKEKVLDALTDIPASLLWAISKTIKFSPIIILTVLLGLAAIFVTDKATFIQIWEYLSNLRR